MSTLKVGAIQSATGNASITIANDGTLDGTLTLASPPIITAPILLCAFSNTTLSSTGIIPFNQINYDTANAHNTSTSVYTCPRAGYYEVMFHYLLRSNTSGHRTNVRKNSVPQNVAFDSTNNGRSLIWQYSNGAEEHTVGGSTIVQCALNDTLDVHLYYLANGDIYGTSNAHNQLTIKYLG